MATQKPIATISYNSEAFLKEKLEEWKAAHIIQTYMYIFHKGEDGDKDHFHVRIEPNKRVDPMDLSEALQEFQLGKKKPLGVRPWRPSKEEDWFLYAVHDKKYLKYKYAGGEKGEKIEYKWQDIVVPDDYDLEVAFLRAKSKLEHTSSNLATRLKQGDKPVNLILEGENVYTVNALVRALSENDYQRVARELQETQEQLMALTDAVYAYGLSIECDDNGKIVIKGDNDNDSSGNLLKRES